MRYFYLTIITTTLMFANTSVFVHDVNVQHGAEYGDCAFCYVEIKIISEEPIVGFQFSITSSTMERDDPSFSFLMNRSKFILFPWATASTVPLGLFRTQPTISNSRACLSVK